MKISDLAKRFLLIICILAALFIAGSVIYYRSSSCLPFVYGVVLGSAASVVKVIILDKTVDKALNMEKKAASNYARLNHVLRLLLTAAVLVLAALVPGISLWGAAAGILAFQAAVYIQRWFVKK
ncbi:MAG: ATP synthase subunit I [Christensenellales bacterium]|jgi:hypothetical protein